jgi:hypothetical protein
MLFASHLPYGHIRYYPQGYDNAFAAVQPPKYDNRIVRGVDNGLRYTLSPQWYMVVDRVLPVISKPQETVQRLGVTLAEKNVPFYEYLNQAIAAMISASLLLSSTGLIVLRTLFIVMKRRG